MKTYAKMYKEMFDEIYKSPEGWPPYLTQSKFAERVAKEYAKQWVDDACKKSWKCFSDEDEYHIFETVVVNDIKNQIDAQ